MDPMRPASTGSTAIPAGAPSGPQTRKNTEAAEKARDFEAVFLGQMAGLMLESVQTGDQFPGGHGEEMFRGVLAEQLGTEMAKRGGIGIAPLVLDQIIRLQGNSNGQ
jgi:Rod binding domain-containing protein